MELILYLTIRMIYNMLLPLYIDVYNVKIAYSDSILHKNYSSLLNIQCLQVSGYIKQNENKPKSNKLGRKGPCTL